MKQLFHFLQFIQQPSALQTHSHLLWEEAEQPEGEWRKMLQHSSQRGHTHTCCHILTTCVVLQGWEHSTSASLGKDAKCVQVRH